MKKMIKLLAFALVCVMLLPLFTACTEERNGDVYVIYSEKEFAPFEYYDEDSESYVGVDMDILAAIAKDRGFEYEVKHVVFDEAMTAVQAGQADAMMAGMTISEKRKATFDFSDGYFENGSILVVAEDSGIASLEDLSGKTVAVKKGTTSATYAETVKIEYGFDIAYASESPEMYNNVVSGNADACFEDYSSIGWTIKNGEYKLKTVGDMVNLGYYGFAVKKGQNWELLAMFYEGLKNIKESGEYAEILARYGYTAEE